MFNKLLGRENYQDWGTKVYLRDQNLWYSVVGYPGDDTTDAATKKKYDQRAPTKNRPHGVAVLLSTYS